jgi:hypothetical protein
MRNKAADANRIAQKVRTLPNCMGFRRISFMVNLVESCFESVFALGGLSSLLRFVIGLEPEKYQRSARTPRQRNTSKETLHKPSLAVPIFPMIQNYTYSPALFWAF